MQWSWFEGVVGAGQMGGDGGQVASLVGAEMLADGTSLQVKFKNRILHKNNSLGTYYITQYLGYSSTVFEGYIIPLCTRSHAMSTSKVTTRSCTSKVV